MPLTFDWAYGGPAVVDNPVGTGAEPGSRPANIVLPAAPAGPPGFGPIARTWPARSQLLGVLDRETLEQPLVDIPNGFDWRYFQAAPRDQQFDFLRGDEWLVLDGLHVDLPRMQTQLPCVRAAARWHVLSPSGLGEGRPIELRADTLVIDADYQVCSLIWRGCFKFDRLDMLASLRVFAGVERADQPIQWPSSAGLIAVPGVTSSVGGSAALGTGSPASPTVSSSSQVADPPVVRPPEAPANPSPAPMGRPPVTRPLAATAPLDDAALALSPPVLPFGASDQRSAGQSPAPLGRPPGGEAARSNRAVGRRRASSQPPGPPVRRVSSTVCWTISSTLGSPTGGEAARSNRGVGRRRASSQPPGPPVWRVKSTVCWTISGPRAAPTCREAARSDDGCE